jgi:hypothetical protein
MVAAYRVHKLIQDLNRNPDDSARFARDPVPFFDAYELSESERSALTTGTKAALIDIGVHPNLQMKFFRIVNPSSPDQPGIFAVYLQRSD